MDTCRSGGTSWRLVRRHRPGDRIDGDAVLLAGPFERDVSLADVLQDALRIVSGGRSVATAPWQLDRHHGVGRDKRADLRRQRDVVAVVTGPPAARLPPWRPGAAWRVRSWSPVPGLVGTPAIGVVAAVGHRVALPDARFRLRQPAVRLFGTLDQVEAGRRAHRDLLVRFQAHLARATGRPVDEIADVMRRGRDLDAREALTTG
jgi:Clp protease